MKCDKCIKEYLEQETPGDLSFRAKIHLLLCSSCRTEIERLDTAFALLRNVNEPPAPRDFTEVVMLALEEEESLEEKKEMDFWKWVTGGIVILVSVVIASIAEPYLTARGMYGDHYLLYMSIIFGVLLSVYGAFFIAGNLDDFSHRLNLKRPL